MEFHSSREQRSLASLRRGDGSDRLLFSDGRASCLSVPGFPLVSHGNGKKDDGIMARPLHASAKLPLQTFEPLSTICLTCGNAAHIAYHTQRTITTLTGRYRLHLAVRRCISPPCPRYHLPYRPEAEGAWALPHGEYGLDVIALVGALRYQRHQSLTEIHNSLNARGLSIGERTVLNLLVRYEGLVTIHMTDRERLQSLVQKQESLILAVDGLHPNVGHARLVGDSRLCFRRDPARPASAQRN